MLSTSICHQINCAVTTKNTNHGAQIFNSSQGPKISRRKAQNCTFGSGDDVGAQVVQCGHDREYQQDEPNLLGYYTKEG